MWKLLIFTICLVQVIDGANILVILPVPAKGQQEIYRKLLQSLEDRGHSLTVISTDPGLGREHANTTEIDINFTYVLMEKALFTMSFADTQDELGYLAAWSPYEIDILEKQLSSEGVQNLIKSKGEKKFDAVIVEYIGHTPWYALAEYFDAPLIGLTATETTLEFHEALGNGANPIKDPDLLIRYSIITNFRERLHAWRFYLLYNFYYKCKFNALYDKLIRKYLPDVKSSSQQLKGKADLLLTNTHPAMNYVRPLLPTTIQLGFMHIDAPREIEDMELNEFLEKSEKPIIYMSFGSDIKSSELQDSFIQIFKNVFKTLPFNIIWKWEKDEMANKPDNVFITQWVPQADLLAHPKIKLFITHGSQLSMEEGIDRAVPMIILPFYTDHGANALRAQQLNIANAISLQSLDERVLRQAIDDVMYGKYRENIQRLRNIIHDAPMRPVEKAVWWIEYTIRHNGTKHLQYSGKNVPFYQKYMLDFIAIAVIILHAIIRFTKPKLESCLLKVVKRIFEKKDKKFGKIAKKIKKKKGEKEE